jgi:ankyrin repeat protein
MSLLPRTMSFFIAFSAVLSCGAAIAGPLHDAARTGDPALIQVLFEAGADVNGLDEAGETPLMSAARASNLRTMDRLLILGADASARDGDGLLALHWAAFTGDPQSVARLLGWVKNRGDVSETIDDAQNRFGVTPLILAAELNHGGVVASLVTFGADLEIADVHGRTALTLAAVEGNDEIIRILLRGGAACQTTDPVWYAECTKYKSAIGR